MKKTNYVYNNTKGASNMKKNVLFVLALAACLVFAFTAVATAKYAGHSVNDAYLSWDGAKVVAGNIDAAEGTTTSMLSPHGGYTQTSVKCVVCHSIHRATTGATAIGAGVSNSLLNGTSKGNACANCHSAWGASPSAAIVAIGETYSGPHIGAGGSSCTNRGCHGSVHGIGADTTFAVVAKYNLQNPSIATATDPAISAYNVGSGSENLTAFMSAAIAGGNVNAQISTEAAGDAMKAFATGYVCSPCHGNSSFSVAAPGAANPISLAGENVMASGHPSANAQFYGHAPTCEKCHDLVDVASNSTAFPHADRGIDVYTGRFNYDLNVGSYGAGGVADLTNTGTISTDNGNATRYGLWMTASEYSEADTVVDPLEYNTLAGSGGGAFSIRDGSCLKCHLTDGSAYSIP